MFSTKGIQRAKQKYGHTTMKNYIPAMMKAVSDSENSNEDPSEDPASNEETIYKHDMMI